ncbi:hypothetical protein NLJ89_g3498 [Agrocybe chaxingu]|uniref:Cyclin N-terminal domain-containing protein n=1 Tax=Agrocybe chaxingu TaxID=84603 RepID=A0A9W8K3W5_9AGAR|nr:hypothetical protein NLJ89_g3498 [Agrocybe chaxingu]
MTAIDANTAAYAAPPTPNYDTISRICAAYINHLFGSMRYPFPSTHSIWQTRLPSYIKAALQFSQLDVSIVVAAMTLLGQYKDVVPTSVAYYDDAYRLFMSAYLVAAKVSCDTPRTLRWWRIVGRGKFNEEELVKMEMELCRVLKWNVQVDEEKFRYFKCIVEHYAGPITSEAMGIADSSCVLEPGSVVYDSPPPLYQDSGRDLRMVEVAAMSPVGSFVGLDEDDEALLEELLESPTFRPLPLERACPLRTSNSDIVRPRRSFRRRVLRIIFNNRRVS